MLGGLDGSLHLTLPSMNRFNQTEPAKSAILLFWAFFRGSFFFPLYFPTSFSFHRSWYTLCGDPSEICLVSIMFPPVEHIYICFFIIFGFSIIWNIIKMIFDIHRKDISSVFVWLLRFSFKVIKLVSTHYHYWWMTTDIFFIFISFNTSLSLFWSWWCFSKEVFIFIIMFLLRIVRIRALTRRSL